MFDAAILIPYVLLDAILGPGVHLNLCQFIKVVELGSETVADSVELLNFAVVHDDGARQLLLDISISEDGQSVVVE